MKRLVRHVLSRISPERVQQDNIWKSARTGMLTTANATLVSVPILQVFAIHMGADESQLGVVRFFAQLAVTAGFVLFSARAARCPEKELVPTYTRLNLFHAVLPAAMLLASLLLLPGYIGTTAGLWIITAGWMLSNFVSAYYVMVMTRMEACLYSESIYGAVYGFCGILFYLVSALLGAAVGPLLGSHAATWGFPVVFALSLGLGVGAFYSARGYVLVRTPQSAAPAETKPRRPSAAGQALPIGVMHVLRGAISGIYYFIMLIGMRFFGLTASDAGLLTVLGTFSSMIAYFFILFVADRLGVVRSSLLSVVINVLALGLLVMVRSRSVFMASYFLYGIGIAVLNQMMPIGVLRTVDQAHLATVTAVRFVALQLSDALTSLSIGPVVLAVYPWFLLLACALQMTNMVLIRHCFGKPRASSDG